MSDDDDVIFDADEWEPVNSGDYNPTKFVKPGADETTEDEVALEPDQYVQGTFEGVTELGGVPNFEVSNNQGEVNYMFSKQMVLESELEEVEEGDLIRIRFDGEKENEDGTRTYYDWTVLRPAQ